MKAKYNTIGEWAFLLGVVIAIIAGIPGLVPEANMGLVATGLVILGLIVGLLNITQKESPTFLVAAIALLLAGTAGLDELPMVGAWIGGILTNIATFVAPAAVIVALKVVYELASK